MIVGNAFGALVAAIILQVTSQFSFTQFVWQFCLDLLHPLIQGIEHLLPHSGAADRFGAWFTWYTQNRFKLAFWLFYTTAICDDLGLPNFKTLGRYAWRRLRRGYERRALQNETLSPRNPDCAASQPCAEPSPRARPE